MNITESNSPFVWHLDERDATWKYGSSQEGMGVFRDLSEGSPEMKWFGNVVVHPSWVILGFGPYDTIEEAMKECETAFLRLKVGNST